MRIESNANFSVTLSKQGTHYHLLYCQHLNNIGTQGVQELFFVNWKVSEIAELNRWHIKCFIKQTTVIWHVSKLILTSVYFLTGQAIWFNNPHCDWCDMRTYITPRHSSISYPFQPEEGFCSKILKLRERFAYLYES